MYGLPWAIISLRRRGGAHVPVARSLAGVSLVFCVYLVVAILHVGCPGAHGLETDDAPNGLALNPHANKARGWIPIARLLALAKDSRRESGDGEDVSRTKCTKAADCPLGSLCGMDGTCKCPVLYNGNANCSAHTKLSKEVEACATPITSAKILSRLTNDRKGKHAGKVGIQPFLSAPEKNGLPLSLPDIADFSTCAVVASSGRLKQTRPGKEIDKHTAVFRMNDAPTKGFNTIAGSKTTVRVQNRDYLGFSEKKAGEMCLCYSARDVIPDARRSPRTYARWKTCPVKAAISGKAWNYFQTYWRMVGKPKGAGNDKLGVRLSAGMSAIVMAMHVCAEVTAFGFQGGIGHYYKKPGETSKHRRDFAKRHAWVFEKHCMDKFRGGSLPGLKIV